MLPNKPADPITPVRHVARLRHSVAKIFGEIPPADQVKTAIEELIIQKIKIRISSSIGCYSFPYLRKLLAECDRLIEIESRPAEQMPSPATEPEPAWASPPPEGPDRKLSLYPDDD